MTHELILYLSTIAYLAAATITARMTFLRVRPERLRTDHMRPWGRKMADGHTLWIDSDICAAWMSALAGLFWWAVLWYAVITFAPPETPAERRQRLDDLARRNRDLERENARLQAERSAQLAAGADARFHREPEHGTGLMATLRRHGLIWPAN